MNQNKFLRPFAYLLVLAKNGKKFKKIGKNKPKV